MIPRKARLIRACDRLAGPSLLRLMRAPKGPDPGPLAAESVQRTLIVRPGGLGDAILTLPMIQALRAVFPDSTIDVLAEQRNAGVYGIDDVVEEVLRYDTQPVAIFRRLREKNYDLVIDTEQYHRLSRCVASALRPRSLCGFDTVDGGRLLTHAVAFDDDTYEVESFLALARALTGAPILFDADAAFVRVRRDASEWARQQLEIFEGRPVISVSPVSAWVYKLWPPERYSEAVRWLTQEGFGVVLLGGADGLAAAGAIMADDRSGQVLNLVGRTTLAQTAGILANTSLSLSTDTGILHLAYGLGTPTVALFGAGRHMKWAPPGRNHRTVRKGLACSPCTTLGRTPACPYNIACMHDIGVAEVIGAMKELL